MARNGKVKSPARKERLAEALRANLARRKEWQRRGRGDGQEVNAMGESDETAAATTDGRDD